MTNKKFKKIVEWKNEGNIAIPIVWALGILFGMFSSTTNSIIILIFGTICFSCIALSSVERKVHWEETKDEL